jgi:hypothetical protein
MRVQILSLPPVVLDDLVRTPFVLVVDECGDDSLRDPATLGEAVQEIGAEGVLIFTQRVEVV